jgi:hypothetical protein
MPCTLRRPGREAPKSPAHNGVATLKPAPKASRRDEQQLRKGVHP